MSAYWKDLFREIKKTLGRFISLLVITALGAASVVGIHAASIDMRAIADRTYKEHNLYDLQLKSTIGFDEDDLAELNGTAGVSAVMPTYIYDVFIRLENENQAIRTYALPDNINKLDLLEGRLPVNAEECVIERRLLDEAELEIGESIKLGLDDMSDYYDILIGDVFTVVGVVSSPLYISFQRGNTSIGDGSLEYYIYLHPDAYILDVYTDVYLLMDGSQEMDNLTDGYYAVADGFKRSAEQTGIRRIDAKKELLSEAQREIGDGWIEYNSGVTELNEKIAEGRRELEDALDKLSGAKRELEDGQRTLDERIAEGVREIDRMEAELERGREELEDRRTELYNGQIQLDNERIKLEQTLAQLVLTGPQGISPELDTYYEQVYDGLRQIENQQTELDAGIIALSDAETSINDGIRQISDARKNLEEERIRAQREIDDGWNLYYDGLEEYNDGIQTIEAEETDAKRELDDAKRELEDAQEKLDDTPVPEWFYFTREDGLSFDSYYQDTLRLQKIGYVFPLMFFLVAVLVSLTSMSRMVSEHRTQIGIYKALGYRPAAIMTKYLFYAFSSGLAGGVLGIITGSKLFPLIIADAYGHMYDMPPIDMPVPVLISMLTVILAVLSVVLVTLWTCISSMTGTPARLMRPPSPPEGKRVLLERLPFVWNRFGFFSKVTARNIFRYKRRFIMTLFGVAGCSALLITAFGLRDSIEGVGILQYESIVKYDARAYLRDITSDSQRAGLDEMMPENHLYIREEAVTADGIYGSLPASLIIPEISENLNGYFNLYSPETGEVSEMSSGSVLISSKLARVTGAGVGSGITLTYSDGKEYTAEITGIADNYIGHFIYMSPDVYTELSGEEPHPNSALIFCGEGRDFAAPLLENADIRTLVYNDEIKEMVVDSTDALGIVTIVLIILACALALVVLFNLTNINISERIRELATIKVLGFFDFELALYIYRENGVVTLLGIILGLFAGIFLHGFVITTVEIDILKFPKIIYPQSFIYAAVLSFVFAVFVNLVMNKKLSRIDMVESLKNVE